MGEMIKGEPNGDQRGTADVQNVGVQNVRERERERVMSREK